MFLVFLFNIQHFSTRCTPFLTSLLQEVKVVRGTRGPRCPPPSQGAGADGADGADGGGAGLPREVTEYVAPVSHTTTSERCASSPP